MAAPTIVQVSAIKDCNSSGTPKAITYGTAVTAGNLLIAFIGGNQNPPPNVSPAWTAFATVQRPGANDYILALYRYAQAGDGTQPPDWTADAFPSTQRMASVGYEINGANALWSIALDSLVSDSVAAQPSTVTAPLTTVADDVLVLMSGYDDKIFSAVPAVGAPFAQDHANAFFFAALVCGNVTEAAHGTVVSTTITWNQTGDDSSTYVVVGLKASAPAPLPKLLASPALPINVSAFVTTGSGRYAR